MISSVSHHCKLSNPMPQCQITSSLLLQRVAGTGYVRQDVPICSWWRNSPVCSALWTLLACLLITFPPVAYTGVFLYTLTSSNDLWAVVWDIIGACSLADSFCSVGCTTPAYTAPLCLCCIIRKSDVFCQFLNPWYKTHVHCILMWNVCWYPK